MVVVIDPQIAGISGDMLLSSLVDCGANKNKIIDGIHLIENFVDDSNIKKIEFSKVRKHGIDATQLILELHEKKHERKATEIQNCIQKSSAKIGLSEKANFFVNSSINTLMEAEAKIHGVSLDSVHLHEASSMDTVIDIIGTGIALDDLNFFNNKIITCPVAVGGGFVSFSHGTTSNPANAILEIFKNSNLVIKGGGVRDELTTPTGASMIVNLAQECSEFYPQMKVSNIGYGAGKKDFDGFSNVLRIVHGNISTRFETDTVQILETNVDDISGEILGNLIDKIMESGARDISISPAVTKKGRPSHQISVICDNQTLDSVLDVLLSETGTLGVRISQSQRITIPREYRNETVSTENENFVIRIKTFGTNFKSFKIESDDIKKVSLQIHKSYKETENILKNLIQKKLESN